jgi:hypothetical protein
MWSNRRSQPGRPVHTGRQQRHLGAERPQQRRERAVELVAETAAAADHLGHQAVLVELDRHAEVDVEVLERHRGQVPLVQLGQRRTVHSGRSCGSDAVEVGVDVHPAIHRADRPLSAKS